MIELPDDQLAMILPRNLLKMPVEEQQDSDEVSNEGDDDEKSSKEDAAYDDDEKSSKEDAANDDAASRRTPPQNDDLERATDDHDYHDEPILDETATDEEPVWELPSDVEGDDPADEPQRPKKKRRGKARGRPGSSDRRWAALERDSATAMAQRDIRTP